MRTPSLWWALTALLLLLLGLKALEHGLERRMPERLSRESGPSRATPAAESSEPLEERSQAPAGPASAARLPPASVAARPRPTPGAKATELSRAPAALRPLLTRPPSKPAPPPPPIYLAPKSPPPEESGEEDAPPSEGRRDQGSWSRGPEPSLPTAR